MKLETISWITHALRVFHRNSGWMAWNLFLAIVPLALSIWLFRSQQKRNAVWWLGLFVFVAFLPNSPYVLTDIVHFINDIRIYRYSVWVITLIVIPQYLLFILAGLEAYVISIVNLGYYLHRQQASKFILWVELSLHALSAIGIYLGRFLRFNSWDFVTQPDAVLTSVWDDLVGKLPLVVIAITFAVIAGLYWLMKQVTLGVILFRRSQKATRKNNNIDSWTA